MDVAPYNRMEALVNSQVPVWSSGDLTLLSSEAIINNGYSVYRLRPGQFSLLQPWQKANRAAAPVQQEHELPVRRKRKATTTAEHTTTVSSLDKQHLHQDIETVLQAHRQLLDQIQEATSCLNAQPAHTAEHKRPRKHVFTDQQMHHSEVAADPSAPTRTGHATDITSAATAATLTSDHEAEAQPVAHQSAQPSSTAVDAELESPTPDWPAVAAMKHVLKPKISFHYTSQTGQQKSARSKLFDAVIHNHACSEIVAEAFDRQVVLPADCSFCMSDVKSMQPFVQAVQERGGADMLVIDPPWENASAKRSACYSTLTPNHLLYMPVKELVRQSGSSLVALWMTNRPRMHRFVQQQLFPAWGLTHVATWFWLKVTDSGEPATPLGSLHRHPFEQLWLARPVQQPQHQDAQHGQQQQPPGTGQGGEVAPTSAAAVDAATLPPDAVAAPQAIAVVQKQEQKHNANVDPPVLAFPAAFGNVPDGSAKSTSSNASTERHIVQQQCSSPGQAATLQPPDRHVLVSVPGVHSRKPHIRQLLLRYVQCSAACNSNSQSQRVHRTCNAEERVRASDGNEQQRRMQPESGPVLEASPAATVEAAETSGAVDKQPLFVELFARELFRGCMSWGNEAVKFQDLVYWVPAQAPELGGSD